MDNSCLLLSCQIVYFLLFLPRMRTTNVSFHRQTNPLFFRSRQLLCFYISSTTAKMVTKYNRRLNTTVLYVNFFFFETDLLYYFIDSSHSFFVRYVSIHSHQSLRLKTVKNISFQYIIFKTCSF